MKIYPLNVCILQPEGRLCCSYDGEIGDLQSALKHITKNEIIYKMKNIFIGSERQSILLKLKQSPISKHHYLGLDTSILWNLIIQVCKIIKGIILYYVPSHQNIVGNELVDKYAKKITDISSIDT